MKQLSLINTTLDELIPIYSRKEGELVNARDLWQFVESKQEFSAWIKRRVKQAMLDENADFVIVKPSAFHSKIGTKSILPVDKSINGEGSAVDKSINGGKFLAKEYALTLDSAKHIGMLEGNEKGKQIRSYFIQVQKYEEARRLHMQNAERIQERKNGKLVRRETTDAIKEFIEYAKANGSQSADKYYMLVTKAVYKCLEMIEGNGPVPKNMRDMLDARNLRVLATAEDVARCAFLEGISQGMFYRDIFQFAKNHVEAYAKTVMPTLKGSRLRLIKSA